MAVNRVITTYEHRSLPVDGATTANGITLPEAEVLLEIGFMRQGFVELRHNELRLAQYCGVVSLGDRVLEVLPKVGEHELAAASRGTLLRLLRLAGDTTVFRHVSTGQHMQRAPLIEVFIGAFFDSIVSVVRGGLLRNYLEHEDDLRVVRGRIVEARQFSIHSNRPDRVACRYDELTPNNIWNQMLKAALRLTKPWISSVDLRRRWSELVVVFDEVADIDPAKLLGRKLVFDRRAARYRTAIEWARWILSLLSPSVRAGQNRAPGLLFDMNLLFQTAVARLLRRQLVANAKVSVSTQVTGTYLATVSGQRKPAFALRPDIVLDIDARRVVVADTKWKRVAVSSSGFLLPAEDDMYQMNAYASAFGCDRLALIYPWHDGLSHAKPTVFELRSGGAVSNLEVICVDVGDPFFKVPLSDAAELGAALLGSV